MTLLKVSLVVLVLQVCLFSYSRAEDDPAEIPLDIVIDVYESSDPTVPSSGFDEQYIEDHGEENVVTHYRTPNVIDDQNWTGLTYGNDPGGCCASISGSGPMFDQQTNTIMYSYGMSTIQQVIAINQVFQNTGISVDGYTYDMMFKRIGNGNNARDNLYVDIIIKDASGNEVEQKTYDLSGNPNEHWEYFHAMQLFQSHYLDPQNATVRIRGKDGGFWAGYYGPEVKDVDFRLIYRSDPCAADPLHDPSCNGYADAYAEREYNNNCTANSLYDSGCPGYEQAYFDQQCNADPLYNQSCPGYASAYFDYQCSADPLYDSACPGYAEALYDQNCAADPLFDSGCPGYETAYYDLQCSIDTLYDSGCPGYTEAYYDYQCSLDALYDRECPGYAEAYAKENLLNEQTTSTPETVSAAPETVLPITDPEEIGKPSTTGDAAVDSILSDLSDSVTVAVVVTEPVVDVAPEPSQEEEREEEVTSDLPEPSSDVEESVEASGNEIDSGLTNEENQENTESDSSGSTEPREQDSKKEKMKKAVAKKAASLAERMSEAASLEAQQAVQAQVLALINYTPGFNDYQTALNGGYLPDAQGYADTQVPESRRGLRNGLAQQLLHEKMVDMQYENLSR